MIKKFCLLLGALVVALSVTIAVADVTRVVASYLTSTSINPLAGGTPPVLLGTAAPNIDTTVDSNIPGMQEFIVADYNNTTSGYCGYDGGNGYGAYGTKIDYLKTRSTSNTCDANVIVQSGDLITEWDFYGSNGTVFKSAAQMRVGIDGTPGSGTDMPGYFEWLVSPDGSATVASALKLGNDKTAAFGGKITSSATSIGWQVVAGANTACNTTCGTHGACVFGFDTALGGLDLVDCASAIADRCLCAAAT